MRFGRVLATTALVAVLASSLFSGWLTASSSIFKPPIAQAADYNTTCSAQSNQLEVTANFSVTTSSTSELLAKTVKATVSVRYTGLLPETVTLVKAALYRAASSNSDFGSVGSITLTKAGGTWQGEFTNTLPIGTYKFFVQATATIGSAQEKRCSSQSIDFVNSATTTTGSSHTKGEVWEWFRGIGTIGTYPINISETQNKPPTITIPAGAGGARNPELTFALKHVSGTYTSYEKLGAIGGLFGAYIGLKSGSNQSWTIFEADGTPNLIILGDNKGNAGGSNWEMLYLDGTFDATDPNTHGQSNPASVQVTNSFNELYRYVNDSPPNPGDNSCADGRVLTGPKAGPNSTPKKVEGSDGYIQGLNSNCLNRNGSGGWPDWWGLGVTSEAGDAADNACGLQAIVGGIGQGIGGIIGKLLGCMVQSFLKGAFGTGTYNKETGEPSDGIQKYLYELIKISQIDPVEPNHLPKIAGILGIKKAYAADKTGDFETELMQEKSILRIGWGISLSLLNIVLVLALLAIAFANILHLNISVYAAKKALPGLVIGAVGANASYLFIRFLADVATALTYLAVQVANVGCERGIDIGCQVDSVSDLLMSALIMPIILIVLGAVVGAIGTLLGGFVTAGVSVIVAIIFAIIALYFLFLLIAFGIAFLKRIVILYFLVMVAPLAFISYGIPNFQKYFTLWWENFLRYLFLFPIIIFGAAMVKIVADNVGFFRLTANEWFTTPGIVSIALYITALTYVVKLPKIITKGAIDIGAMFKKTLSAAPLIAGGAVGIHKFAKGGGVESFKAKLAGIKSSKYLSKHFNKDGQAALDAKKFALEAQIKRKAYKKNPMAKRLGTARGYATLFGRPELLKAAWDERTAAGQKADLISAAKTGWLGKAKGPQGEFKAEAEFAEEGLKSVLSSNDVKTWAEANLPKGAMLKAGDTDKDGNTMSEDGMFVGFENALKDPGKKLSLSQQHQLRARIRQARGPDEVQEIFDELNLGGNYSPGDLSKFKSLQQTMHQNAVKQNLQETDNVEHNYQKKMARVNPAAAAPSGGPSGGANPPNTPPDGSGGGNPSGGAGPGGETGPIGGFDQAAFNSHLDRVVQHLDNLKVGIDDADLTRLANLVPLANTPHTMDVEAMKEALKAVTQPEFHDKINDVNLSPDDLAAMVHEFSIAAASGGNVETIRQQLAGSHVMGGLIDRQSQDIGSRLSEEQLGEIMGASFEQAMARANEALGPNIAKMNEAISRAGLAAKDQTAVLQKVVTELQGMRNSIASKGPNSLLTISKNMGPMIAKAMDVGHMSTLQAIKEASAASQAKTVEAGQVATESSPPSQQSPAPAEPKDSAVPTPGYEPPSTPIDPSIK